MFFKVLVNYLIIFFNVFIKLIINLNNKNHLNWNNFYELFSEFLQNNTYIIWILGSMNGLLVVLFLFPVVFLFGLHVRNIIYNCKHRND